MLIQTVILISGQTGWKTVIFVLIVIAPAGSRQLGEF